MTRPIGDVVARGSRSGVHGYGRGAVVKIANPSTPARWILYEAEYAEAARAAGAPVPRLLGVEEIGGRPASVWERVDGESMWQRIVAAPERSGELGALLADVHLGLFELTAPVTLPSQRDRLASKIRSAADRVDGSLIRALGLLDRAVGSHLCHGDMHPSNIILSSRGPVIVDWFDASRGAAIADVARTTLTLLGDGIAAPLHLPGADRATLDAVTAGYLDRLRAAEVADLDRLGALQAVNAAARLAEGVPGGELLAVWRGFDAGSRYAASTADRISS